MLKTIENSNLFSKGRQLIFEYYNLRYSKQRLISRGYSLFTNTSNFHNFCTELHRLSKKSDDKGKISNMSNKNSEAFKSLAVDYNR